MSSAPVRMTVEWYVPVAQTRSMTMALHAVAAAIRSTPGCLRCAVTTDINEGGIVGYVEDWDCEEGLRRRLIAENFAPLSRLIEDASRPPRIEFTLVNGYRRGDFLTEVRGNAARAS